MESFDSQDYEYKAINADVTSCEKINKSDIVSGGGYSLVMRVITIQVKIQRETQSSSSQQRRYLFFSRFE